MSKKNWAYLAIAAALAILYSINQVDNAISGTNATLNSVESGLEKIGRLGSPNATPYVPYALLGVGAWLLFG
jgi:hypothetical protein